MKCKECGHDFSGNAKFCPECGKPASLGSKVNCRKCDYELEGSLKFCPECGESVRRDNRGKREDDDDEGGILGGIGDIVGKLFGG